MCVSQHSVFVGFFLCPFVLFVIFVRNDAVIDLDIVPSEVLMLRAHQIQISSFKGFEFKCTDKQDNRQETK
jgi:hypothetical protein